MTVETGGGFDATTGLVRTDAGEAIGPALTRAAFLASSLATGARTIGEGRAFGWGRVASIYGDRSGGSQIVLRYGS